MLFFGKWKIIKILATIIVMGVLLYFLIRGIQNGVVSNA